jgi:fused signal recognition particle receptor
MAQGWFAKLKGGLVKSSNKITQSLTSIVTKRKVDAGMLEELEELLIQADIGVETAAKITADLSKSRFNQEVTPEEIKAFFAERIATTLEPVAQELPLDSSCKPFVIMVVGVNGGGKTTTIGKLAHYWHQKGLKVRLAAGDTFRAAAIAQLQTWAERADVPVFIGKENGDPAGLAYDALEVARHHQEDILIIDTAGRLQNKDNLMAELAKIERVIKKLDPDAPHATILVLDATTGQNAHSQVDLFNKAVNLTGLVVTKLDGTAKGGVLVSLAQKHRLPIYAVGVGEGLEDLRPFDAGDYAKSLMGL